MKTVRSYENYFDHIWKKQQKSEVDIESYNIPW